MLETPESLRAACHDACERISRTCVACPRQFAQRRPWQRFCSAACRAAFHRQQLARDANKWREHVERRLAALEAAAGMGNA